jgi:hypothetical protein
MVLFEAIFWRSWVGFEQSQGHLGLILSFIGASRGHLGPSQGYVEPSTDARGSSCAGRKAILELSSAILHCLTAICAISG